MIFVQCCERMKKYILRNLIFLTFWNYFRGTDEVWKLVGHTSKIQTGRDPSQSSWTKEKRSRKENWRKNRKGKRRGKANETRVKVREQKKKEVEKKIEEKTEKEKEEAKRTKHDLFSEKRKQQQEIKMLKVLLKMRIISQKSQ